MTAKRTSEDVPDQRGRLAVVTGANTGRQLDASPNAPWTRTIAGLGMRSSFPVMGNWDARCWIHQATFSRRLRPRASITSAWTGTTSPVALSEPKGAPTTVRQRGLFVH